MGVLNGQPVDQAITNAAFINKNQNDSMPNILSLTRALSGSTIADIQFTANRLYTCTGASESQTGTVYGAPANTITDGQSHQTALTELADKFDPSTGHTHDGSAGNGGPITSSSIGGVALLQFQIQGSNIVGATGGSTDVTSLMGAFTPSSNNTTAGVIVNTPYNRVLLLYGDSAQYRNQVVDSSGNLIYGRLTYSTGTWTLTYYAEITGVETATSLPATSTLLWYFRELDNPVTTQSPNYNPIFEFFSKTVKSLNTLFGDVTLAVSGGTTLTPSSQTLTFSSPALSSTTPTNVGSTSTVGTGTTTARADHAHQGLHSISKSGSAQIVGDATLTAGTNVTLTQVANDITIDVTSTLTVGTIDSVSKSSDGAVISTGVIYFQTADASFPGMVSTSNQSFLGVKTFSTAIATPEFRLTGSTSGILSHFATAVTTSYSLIWPAAQASGTQVLQNDGAGNLSWATAVASTIVTSNDSSGNITVSSGTALFNPYLNIQSGDTYTVQSSAELVSVSVLTVNGTLIVNGEVRVL